MGDATESSFWTAGTGASYHEQAMTAVEHVVSDAPQASFTIQGRQVRLPVAVRDATAAVAYYVVPASAAQRLIAHTGLRVAQALPGRTLCTIGTMDYLDGDLGTYHEIAVSFFVHERGARAVPVIGAALGFMRGSVGAYIHQLPVDGEFTCEAGQTIWGFPKFMTEIALSTQGDEQVATLRADGQHVLTQAVRIGGRRAFQRTQISYAYRHGVLYRTPSTMGGEGVGFRLGGARLELGAHRLAGELRTLGLPKRALFTTYISKMTGSFGAATALP